MPAVACGTILIARVSVTITKITTMMMTIPRMTSNTIFICCPYLAGATVAVDPLMAVTTTWSPSWNPEDCVVFALHGPGLAVGEFGKVRLAVEVEHHGRRLADERVDQALACWSPPRCRNALERRPDGEQQKQADDSRRPRPAARTARGTGWRRGPPTPPTASMRPMKSTVTTSMMMKIRIRASQMIQPYCTRKSMAASAPPVCRSIDGSTRTTQIACTQKSDPRAVAVMSSLVTDSPLIGPLAAGSLAGKRALVTGSSRGIGADTAQLFRRGRRNRRHQLPQQRGAGAQARRRHRGGGRVRIRDRRRPDRPGLARTACSPRSSGSSAASTSS